MDPVFEYQRKKLYDEAYRIIDAFLRDKRQAAGARLQIPVAFATDFFRLIDQVNASLLEDNDNFYGYFLFQMQREIRFDISSPTATHFKRAKYVLYFNPVIFLTLTQQQMATTIKHEILHICSLHLLRAAELLVAEDVLQHGMGRGQRGGQTRGQANTLKLIAASA